MSERRLGRALRARPRDEYVLSTKVGRVLRPAGADRPATIFTDVGDLEPEFDFSRDGILRSLEESLDRLGIDRIDVVLVHDPDDHEDDALRDAFPTLLRLRDEGVVADGRLRDEPDRDARAVRRAVDLDCVLLAGRYSLLDRSGERAARAVRGTRRRRGHRRSVQHGSARRSRRAPDLRLRGRARRRCSSAARRLQARVRGSRGSRSARAALQFAMRHPAVTTVLVGARSAAEVALDVGLRGRRRSTTTCSPRSRPSA